nr:hypothetical protein Iba_chr07eCG10990 [Ipomoea batatas]
MLAWFMPGTVWPTLTLLGRVFIDCDMTRFEVDDILEAVAVNEVGAELCTTCPGPASGIELPQHQQGVQIVPYHGRPWALFPADSHCLQSFPGKQKWVKKFEGSEQVMDKDYLQQQECNAFALPQFA